MKRRRCDIVLLVHNLLEADSAVSQPYVDQAAADKIRAEKEKEAFTVSVLGIHGCLSIENLISIRSTEQEGEEGRECRKR